MSLFYKQFFYNLYLRVFKARCWCNIQKFLKCSLSRNIWYIYIYIYNARKEDEISRKVLFCQSCMILVLKLLISFHGTFVRTGISKYRNHFPSWVVSFSVDICGTTNLCTSFRVLLFLQFNLLCTTSSNK